MPYHGHVVWMGLNERSDQRLATAFLREHIAGALGGRRLQPQAHDRVLKEEQRKKGAFVAACQYVRENLVRVGLVKDWSGWAFGGAMVAGYPALEPRAPDFWEKFWRIYNRCVARDDAVPALTRRATEES